MRTIDKIVVKLVSVPTRQAVVLRTAVTRGRIAYVLACIRNLAESGYTRITIIKPSAALYPSDASGVNSSAKSECGSLISKHEQ